MCIPVYLSTWCGDGLSIRVKRLDMCIPVYLSTWCGDGLTVFWESYIDVVGSYFIEGD